MQFRSIIDSPCGMYFMLDTLELQSGFSRRVLLESIMMTERETIEESYRKLSAVYNVLVADTSIATKTQLQTIQFKLQGIRDIRQTIERTVSSQLDDVELFEIKHLAILSETVSEMIDHLGLLETKIVDLPDLKAVIEMLDPDGTQIASFYIYDSYSSELRAIRKRLKKDEGEFDEKLFLEASILEDQIRTNLSKRLTSCTAALERALIQLAFFDIYLAKAIQIQKFGLSFPQISSDSKTAFKGLFNPEIREVLQSKQKTYQPIDIDFQSRPILIIGANMGGKTVVLKTLTLSQYLFQFGFGIPAQEAVIDIKQRIYLCMGDEQSTTEGLSSFAAEMKRIDRIIAASRENEKIIALIDEPARTTNPVEGTALVSALIKVLQPMNGNLLLTTHYNVATEKVKRLRVRGLDGEKMNYELIETTDGEVPHEALHIAETLGIDAEWIAEAKKILDCDATE